MLNSTEHEIVNAHKYKYIKKFGLFEAQLSLQCYFSRSYMLKCQQLLAFLTFMGGKNFMFNRVEHEKSFITSGPGTKFIKHQRRRCIFHYYKAENHVTFCGYFVSVFEQNG